MWLKLRILSLISEKNISEPKFSIIHNQQVEIVDNYKYLGTVLDSHLKFDANTDTIVKRGQQRIHLLRKLNSLNVCNAVLCAFYQSFIESLLTFSFVCWSWSGLSMRDRNRKRLNNVVEVRSKIIGIQLRDPHSLWGERVTQRAKQIVRQSDHDLPSEVTVMASGRCSKVPIRKTNTYSVSFTLLHSSFTPSSIRLLNADISCFK